MNLSKHHLALGTVLSAPGGDVFLKSADLTSLVTTWVERCQQPKQRGRLERIVTLELFDYPGPIGFEWVGPCSIPPRLFELAWQLAKPLVGARGAHTHPSSGSSLLLSAAFGTFSHHA
jgi:hypothetical protein